VTVAVADRFRGSWEAFWATTYSFEPELFDEFLFRRLGQPPLNATVLADFDRLARLFAEAGSDPGERSSRANRDYLLRGVSPSGGAFHPKTYFLGNRRAGRLLVGSGNLTLDGLERDHELFSQFASDDEVGLATIRGWRDWTDDLVLRINDDRLRERWIDLKGRLPWLEGPAGPCAFVTNREHALRDQLLDGVAAPIDELHALAPFFDDEARALAGLLAALRPQLLVLYLGEHASVDGAHLAGLLARTPGKVELLGFSPPRFVHAKLLAVVTGGRARLLTGSANLSVAALEGRYELDHWSNVEAGVLQETDATRLRELLHAPPDLEVVPLDCAHVTSLTVRREPNGEPLPLRLLSACQLADDRVEVFLRTRGGAQLPHPLVLADGERRGMVADGRTVQAFPLGEQTRLVWLEDDAGTVLSNRVPPDLTARLRGWLHEPSQPGDERPRELDADDANTPLGRILLRLNQECIFDFEDTEAARRTRRLAGGEAAELGELADEGDWSFVERIAVEQLRYDRRAPRYQALGAPGFAEHDEVFLLLDIMASQVPARAALRLLLGSKEQEPSEQEEGTKWTLEQRQQLRAFNLLERWARALSDPRLLWLNPLSPVRNYAALLVALTECAEHACLAESRLARLVGTTLSSFAQAERPAGYLFSIDVDERARALALLPPSARSLAAALAYSFLRAAAAWRERVFDWQAFLVPALDHGLVVGDEQAAEAVGRMTGERPSAAAVGQRLHWAATYIDEPHWCERTARQLGFTSVGFVKSDVSRYFPVRLTVRGEPAALGATALVSVILRALAFRRCDRLTLDLTGGRLSVTLGDLAYAEVDGVSWESREPITAELLAQLEQLGLPLTTVLHETHGITA
jgi:hypothetical protein